MTMDVNQDREDAESKAIAIFNLGSDALDSLLKLAKHIDSIGVKGQVRRKFMRAIILSALIFARKNKGMFTNSERYNRSVYLLSDLSCKGFLSAAAALNELGISTTAAQKKLLQSLPLSEKHRHDKVVSLSEALEEIKLSTALAGNKRISENHFFMGSDEKHRFEIYRIGKNLFGIRARKQ